MKLARVGVDTGGTFTDVVDPTGRVVKVLSTPDDPAGAVADGVRLTWQRPLRYSGGQRMNDLDHFVIDRAPAEAARPTFVHVGRFDLDDQTRFRKERHIEWVDHDVVPGGRYLYRVLAITLDGYESAPAGPVSVQYRAAAAPPSGAP